MTYGIMIEGSVVMVDDWRPETYIDVGEEIELRVEVRAYATKTGRICVNISRDRGQRGAF